MRLATRVWLVDQLGAFSRQIAQVALPAGWKETTAQQPVL